MYSLLYKENFFVYLIPYIFSLNNYSVDHTRCDEVPSLFVSILWPTKQDFTGPAN